MLKINLMEDDELRQQILNLLRNQIRPLVDQMTSNGIKEEVQARVAKTLDALDVREHVAHHVRMIATNDVQQYIGRGDAFRAMVAEAVAERVDVLVVHELQSIIKPIVKDALKVALHEIIK